MPKYEYRCPKCGAVTEMTRSVDQRNDEPLCFADDCNVSMNLVISKTGFVLSGTGWARDGYSSDKGKQ